MSAITEKCKLTQRTCFFHLSGAVYTHPLLNFWIQTSRRQTTSVQKRQIRRSKSSFCKTGKDQCSLYQRVSWIMCFIMSKNLAAWFHFGPMKESCYPTYGARWVFWCLCNSTNSDMDYTILNVPTDVNAYDCTHGMNRHCKKVCTESWRGKKNETLLHQGTGPASVVC